MKLNLTLKVKVNHCQNNRNLNRGLLHLWSKLGDRSLSRSWVIVRTNKWLTHRLTDKQTQATTIPGGQNWPGVKTLSARYISDESINMLIKAWNPKYHYRCDSQIMTGPFASTCAYFTLPRVTECENWSIYRLMFVVYSWWLNVNIAG